MVDEKHKCYFDMDGKYRPCKGAELLIEYCSPKIEVPQIINFSTGKERELGLAITRTKKHKGLALSYCPFCKQNVCNNKDDLRTDKIPYYEEKNEV